MARSESRASSRFNIKNLDFFAVPIGLWFNGSKNTRTVIGFLFTLGLIGLMIVILYSSGRKLFLRIKPNVVTNTRIINPSNNLCEFNTTDVSFAILNLDSVPHEMIVLNTDNTELSSYLRINAKVISTNTLIELEFCLSNYQAKLNGLNDTLSITNNNDAFILAKVNEELKSANSLCLKNENLYINRTTTDVGEPFIEISAKVIGDLTTVYENINSKLKLKFMLLTKNLDTTNFLVPFEFEIVEKVIDLRQKLTNNIDLWISSTVVKSDIGFILEQFQTERFSSLSDIKSNFSFESFEQTNQLFSIRYNYLYKTLEVERYYMKAQDLAALVGGILQVYMTLAKIVCRFVANNFQQLNFINTLFLKEDFDVFSRMRRKMTKIPHMLKESIRLTHSRSGVIDPSNQLFHKGFAELESDAPIKVSKFYNFENLKSSNAIQLIDLRVRKGSKDLDIEDGARCLSINKLLDINTKNLAKQYLMKINLRYSTFDFFIMKLFCCMDKREENAKFGHLKHILRSKLDLSEIFFEIINYKRYKQYQLTPDQQILLNTDCKLNSETFTPFHLREGNYLLHIKFKETEMANLLLQSISKCAHEGGRLNDALVGHFTSGFKDINKELMAQNRI